MSLCGIPLLNHIFVCNSLQNLNFMWYVYDAMERETQEYEVSYIIYIKYIITYFTYWNFITVYVQLLP